MVSAAFGLARQLAARDDRAGAVEVDQVPLTSRHYCEAQLTSVLTMLDGRPIAEITEADLRDAARRVGELAETEAAGPADACAHAGNRTGLATVRRDTGGGSDLRPVVRRARPARSDRGDAAGTRAALAAAAPSLQPGRPGEFDQTPDMGVSRVLAAQAIAFVPASKVRTGRIGSHSAPVLSLALCAISGGKVWVAPLIAMIADRSCRSFLVTLAMAR